MIKKLKKALAFDLNKGFTLIELLVVIGIIGILATILLLQLGTARAKGRDTKRIADINQVRSANELYFDDNGYYVASNTTANMTAAFVPKYMQILPNDPLANGCAVQGYDGSVQGAAQCYGYAWENNAKPTKYQVWAELEVFNKPALGSDADFVQGDLGAGALGAPNYVADPVDTSSGCTSAANDCVFDLGQK